VALHPTSVTAHWNLAQGLSESWQLEAAMDSLNRAEAMAPQEGAAALRASIALRRGNAELALDTFRGLAAQQPPPARIRSSLAMSAMYSGRLDAMQLAALHRRLFAPLGERARPAAGFVNDRDPKRRLRVGFVSSDFHHQHPVNVFMQPLLRHLDRRAFDITIYFTGTTQDEQTVRVQSLAHRWVYASALDDTRLAQRIEADRIDLLVDLSGHTSQHRLAVFARRAAPVQVSYLGYPGTTGVPNIDWIVADMVVAPEGSEPLFSERIARLPGTVFCFAPGDAYPQPAFPDSDATRPLTFGSFNNAPKLNARTIGLWSRVLTEVPGSRLLLKAPSFTDSATARLFAERFAAHGIAPDRLEFRGPTGLDVMMAEYAELDIALDPIPFNGGTTSLQAMWMGVPVLCIEGDRFSARMSASFMHAAGLHDWVAPDEDGMVAAAQRIAADRDVLLAVRRGLRARLQASPAWDVRRHTEAFGLQLRAMWTDWCSKKNVDSREQIPSVSKNEIDANMNE